MADDARVEVGLEGGGFVVLTDPSQVGEIVDTPAGPRVTVTVTLTTRWQDPAALRAAVVHKLEQARARGLASEQAAKPADDAAPDGEE